MAKTDLRYPIGEFEMPGKLSLGDRARAVEAIEKAPSLLRKAVKGLDDEQLDTRYRPEGWTVRQVVHHLPDSHMNSFIRLKLALTEDLPTVKTYDEAAWATLPDAKAPIEMSLSLLERVHERWVYLWQRLDEPDWDRRFRHPDLGEMRVDELLAFYAWHGKHHTAHINELRKRKKW